MKDIIAARLPDPGAVMSGDFGEIVAYLYQSAVFAPVIGVKKWRLKQDRRKPAPHSDVVHFVTPDWPAASPNDRVICSEVKAKATHGKSQPIVEAIRDMEKDVVSRLARTLAWLRERALTEELGDVTLALLERFLNASEYPLAIRHFRAVAVLSDFLASDELLTVPQTLPPDRTVVVIVIPTLQDAYTTLFQSALQSLP
jgi:hypothetical protein